MFYTSPPTNHNVLQFQISLVFSSPHIEKFIVDRITNMSFTKNMEYKIMVL